MKILFIGDIVGKPGRRAVRELLPGIVEERRIDFVYRLNKDMTFEKEAVYFAFPIAGAKPQFRYEVGGFYER